MTQEEIHEGIKDDHFGPLRLSYSDLQKKYGWSRTALERFLRELKHNGQEYYGEPVKKVDKRSVEARRPLTGRHAHIGYQVLRYRTAKQLNRRDFGRLIGFTSVAIGKIEAGAHDLTLTEVSRIAKEIGQDFDELMDVPASIRMKCP